MSDMPKFQLYLDPLDVSQVVVDFSRFEGVNVSIPTKQISTPDEQREHPPYSLSFDQLAPLVVSISGLGTALVSLAAAILQYKSANMGRYKSLEKPNPTSNLIQIGTSIVRLDDFPDPESLAAFLREHMNIVRIVFLAANPRETSSLDLEEELRSIQNELRAVKHRTRLSFVARHAVRPDDLVRYVREDNPSVIHFSGHGSKDGIILRSDNGGFHSVPGSVLKRFLEGRGVSLVVFNSCFSNEQSVPLKDVVETVIGTTEAVSDEAARRFSVAFYRGLGNGLTIKEAFRDGGDAVALNGLDDVFTYFGNINKTLISTADLG